MRRGKKAAFQPLRKQPDYGEFSLEDKLVEDTLVDSLMETIQAEALKKKASCKSCGSRFAKMGWNNLPKGWTKESVEKFWDSLTGDRKHKTTACHKRMEKHFGDEGAWAFCASLTDMIEGTTEWRGKGK